MRGVPVSRLASQVPTGVVASGRMRRWLIVAVASVLAIGGGLLIWRTVTDPLPGAAAAAQRAATALTERTITDGAFGGTAGPAEVADLTATLRGMGTLRPTITVDDVQLNDDGRRATARLRADWVIHAGKPPWCRRPTSAWCAAPTAGRRSGAGS